jgi:hypothetical protein
MDWPHFLDFLGVISLFFGFTLILFFVVVLLVRYGMRHGYVEINYKRPYYVPAEVTIV